MTGLILVVVLLGLGALTTLLGAKLIERAHPPRGSFLDIGGHRQHVVTMGPPGGAPDRLPVVLLHGAGLNLEDMRLALASRLVETHPLILVDRPGQGWSDQPADKGHSPADQALVLCDVLDRLGIPRSILLGHSWGGTLALTFALDHPERVAGLVLLAPPSHPHLRRLSALYGALATPFAGWLFAHTLALPLAAAAFGRGIRSAFAPQRPPRDYLKRSAAFLLLRPQTFLANAADMASLHNFLRRQAPRYAALDVPVIIIAGDADRIAPSNQHAMLLAAAAPRAHLILLPGIGHMLHHAAAERVVDAVRQLEP